MSDMQRSGTRTTLFITCTGDPAAGGKAAARFGGEALDFLRGCPQLHSVDVFLPEFGDVPTFADGIGPPLIAQIDVDSASGAEELVSAGAFAELIMRDSAWGGLVEDVYLDTFETVHCPLSEASAPPARSAKLSFVVRYYRPVEDETLFIDNYMGHHPRAMTGFPNIRNIVCYLPRPIRSAAGFADSGAFFGNEVVFDDLPALNNALASDVLPRLKAERRQFIPFGRNSHYAMRREQIYCRQ